jgi:hypothetical protein
MNSMPIFELSSSEFEVRIISGINEEESVVIDGRILINI